MIRWLTIFLCATLVLVALEETAPAVGDISRIELLASEVSEAREAVGGLELSEAVHATIREMLDQSAARLAAAAGWRNRADELARLIPAGPARIEALEAELAAVGAAERVLPANSEELRDAVEQTRAEIARLEGELSTAESALAELRERPVAIGARLPQAQTEMGQLAEAAAAPADYEELSPRQAAERLRDRAKLEALRAEVALMENERGAQSLRERLSALRIQVLKTQLPAEREWLVVLERRLGEQVGNEMAGLRRELAAVVESLPAEMADLRKMTDEMEGWIGELEEIARGGERLARRSDRMREKLESLRRDNERLRRQIALGGFEGAFTQLLLDQRQRMQDRRALDYNLRQLDQEITAAQLNGLRIEGLRREVTQSREHWRGDGERVRHLRGVLLDRLDAAQRSTIRELTRLGSDQKAHRDLAVEFSEFLSDQLFWRRSSPPVDAGFFRALGPSVASWFSSAGWRELAVAVSGIPERRPFLAGLTVLVLAGLLAVRRRLRRSIADTGQQIRRISTDRLSHTLLGLLATLALTLPLPLVMGALSMGLASEPDAGPWVRGTARWMGWAAWMLAWILPLRAMAAGGGIGRDHFGWEPEACHSLRQGLKRLMLVYLPPVLIASVTFYERTPHAFDSLGRLAFVAAQAGLIWALTGLFHPSSGVFAGVVREGPGRLLSRTQRLWFGLIVGIPALLIILAGIGYTLTAFVLAERFLIALRWVGAGAIVYKVFLRWLMIKQRRIALQEALELRRTRREALAMARDESTAEESGGPPVVEDEQVELELEHVVRQTRQLARALVGIGVIVAVSQGVVSGLPLEQAGDNFSFLDDWQWLGIMRALLILLVTVTVVKNLPGLFDLAGLRGSGMSPGSRYAVSTLGQYGLAAVGFFMVAGELELDWSRFGWIAAALSVGLGFGLQEIVANFVCGIILLFERPIRVGDVVTVGDVTGSVTRIRMRATTITNWERQEFVVPNKEFITGSLINWTLSNTLNRINIPVGVAYGTDTVKARRILTEIAEAHPQVLADPAPMVAFEAFGDSTLDLVLRCFLPTLENRLRTVTELHEEIDRRFKKAGIEIAFPQHDLHLRSLPDGWSGSGK